MTGPTLLELEVAHAELGDADLVVAVPAALGKAKLKENQKK